MSNEVLLNHLKMKCMSLAQQQINQDMTARICAGMEGTHQRSQNVYCTSGGAAGI